MLHIGQRVTLTIFMHPAGKATLTSGVLPRKALQLARDWVGPGLAAIAPSLRTGPVMVETDLDKEGQVRLPKVSVFGKDQNFLWRDTPATWRTDAILAATQTALLPDTPAELREFVNAYPQRMALDAADTLAYLCTSPYDVRLAQERFPKIHFHPLREHAGLALQNAG